MARMTRRDFVTTTAMTAGVVAASADAALGAPAVRRSQARPIVVASGNAHRFRNGGTETCVERAFRLMTAGTDVLEALVAGINIVELDPAENSVGFGGLPNADGVVQLDACCMHGATRRAGGVAALEGVRTPASVAKAVLDHTAHRLLVGVGAQTFARQLGFTIEDDLNTPESRRLWLEWKRRVDPARYLDPATRADAGWAATQQMLADGLIDRNRFHGTITASGLTARGVLAGVTSTSGLSWKIPGRVGDSPILGAGLYVDGEVGAAGSTGRGEANLYGLSCFLVVESMRRGMSPKDAGLEALRRVRANTVEKRLLNARGEPNFNLTFYMMNARGDHAAVAFYGETARYAVCTENGGELLPIEPLLAGGPQ